MWARAALRVAMRGPGKVLLAASAVGWIAMVWLATSGSAGHSVNAHDHGPPVFGAALPFGSASHFAAMWFAMTLAMAPPLLLRELGGLWRGSLRRLRLRATGAFAAGYVGVWLLVGVGAAGVCAIASRLPLGGGWSGTALTLAAVGVSIGLWHCSPARQRCLNACHRVPALRVFGAAAQWDALRYGVSTGGYCAATCGPAMVIVLLAGDLHLVAMAVAAIAATVERYRPARRPAWRLPLVSGDAPAWPGVPATSWRP
jgi:predicted metal-binding membrane protein